MPLSEFMDKLAKIRASYCEDLPTPELAVLTKTITRLRSAGLQDRCLQVGETVPDFDCQLAGAGTKRFYDVLAQGPVVLNFFRGFWCQYCKTEIEAYEHIQGELAQLGCTYLAVSPQRPVTATSLPHNYQVIFDRGNEIARHFGIVFELDDNERALFQSWGLHLDEVNDADSWELPIPATFVVRKDRTIGFEYVDVDFRARCCPEQLVEELAGLLPDADEGLR